MYKTLKSCCFVSVDGQLDKDVYVIETNLRV